MYTSHHVCIALKLHGLMQLLRLSLLAGIPLTWQAHLE